MVVYLDIVILLNFLVDFLLLLGTNRLSGFPPSAGRSALAALLGAIHSGACLLPGFRFLGNFLWRLVSLCLMAGIAFGWNNSALKRCGVFVLLTMALGGIALQFARGNFISVLLAAGLLALLCHLSFDATVGGREYIPVKITSGERSVSLIALQDSGNTLRDPITGEQVLVISADAARILTQLTPGQLRTPLETLAKYPAAGYRLIPYCAVGGSGMLLAKRFHNVTIGSRKQSAVVAFATEGFGKETMYQALTGGML